MTFDVFISHASEDKDAIVRPLAMALQQQGLEVWFDEAQIRLGDSLRRKIDDGLSKSRFGVVVLSPAFFSKEWPQKELDGLVAREDGTGTVILPIWHNVSFEQVRAFSPPLADKLGAPSSKGVDHLVREIVRAVAPLKKLAAPAVKRLRESAIDHLIVELIDRVTGLAEDGADPVTGLKTGFSDFDRWTTGLQAGELTLVAGRPTSGKTAFFVGAAMAAACDQGLPVTYLTLGSSKTKLAERMVGALGGIPSHHLTTGRLDNQQWSKLVDTSELLARSPISVVDGIDVTIDEVLSVVRERHREHGTLGLAVVDALQDIEGADGGRLREFLTKLRRITRELNIPTLVGLSLSRSIESRPDKRPMLTDIDNLGELSNLADTVVFLYRRRVYEYHADKDDLVEVIVAKQSHTGQVGTILLALNPRTGSLSAVEHPAPNSEQ